MDRVSGRKDGRDKRVPTESRPSKFYEGKQFRYFDRLTNIPYGSQIAYKVILGKPIELFNRDLSIWEGGREYLVYRDTPEITFTGILADAGVLSPLNSNGPQITPDISIQRAVGSGIFTPSVTDIPIIGTGILTDGNSNRASSVYTPDSLRLGVPATTMWLVLNSIGANSVTNGHISLAYEEI